MKTSTLLILALVFGLALSFCNGQAKIYRVPEDFPSINSALESAQAGDTVFVDAGIYNESVTLKQGVTLKGIDATRCRIAGNDSSDVITGADDAVLEGFRIQSHPGRYFGVFCDSTSPTIRGNIIAENGGGIRLVSSSAIVEENLIARNDDLSDFGTVGISIEGGSPAVRANSIIDNNARFAILCDGGQPVIEENLLAFNLGGIGCFDDAAPILRANLLWRNAMSGDYVGCEPDSASLQVDPLFVDPGLKDYRLQSRSPCLTGTRPIGAVDLMQEQR
jgi:parallel beta-helix repeat protein